MMQRGGWCFLLALLHIHTGPTPAHNSVSPQVSQGRGTRLRQRLPPFPVPRPLPPVAV